MTCELKRYTVLFSDGIGNGGFLPDAPSAENTVSSLKAAERLFRDWLRDSGNDYQRGDGYGAPAAWVYLTSEYDGIAYGDYPHAAYQYGRRGGVERVSL